MKLKTACQHCNASLSVSTHLLGTSVRCPQCHKPFVVESGRSPTSAHSIENSPEAARTTMTGSASDTGGESRNSHTLPPTRTIGRFELKAILGQGGFGKVYRAYDPQLDREVALKVPIFGPHDTEKKKRFRAEAISAARLRHPHIVPTFDSGTDGRFDFIASQYVRGRTLSEILKEGTVDRRAGILWLSKIARALEYSHGMGIIHRDVKPHNIMLDERGEPQLMDFGLAKRINEDSGVTTEGALLGTPAYMAPEQARGDIDQIDATTDQYALGVILYELLSGSRPFDGSPHAVLSQILTKEPKRLRTINADIPRDLQAIVDKAMSKERGQRYDSCKALADDLEHWLAGKTTLARPITPIERFYRWTLRNRLLGITTAASLLALVAIAILGFSFAAYQAYASLQLRAEQRKTQSALVHAEKEKDRAENERLRAEDQRRLAEEQSSIAKSHQQAEAAQRALADDRTKLAQQSSYIANIQMASAKWMSHDFIGMETALNGLRPKPREQDLRGWEWNYLWNLSHDNAYPIPGNCVGVVWGAHGAQIAQTDTDGGILVQGQSKGVCSFKIPKPDGNERYTLMVNTRGSRVVAWTHAGQVNVYDAARGNLVLSLKISDLGKPLDKNRYSLVPHLSNVAINDTGTRIAIAAGMLEIVRVYDLSTPTAFVPMKKLPHGESNGLVFTPDGASLLVLVSDSHSGGGKPHLWNASTGEPRQLIDPQNQSPFESMIAADVSPDGKAMVAGVCVRTKFKYGLFERGSTCELRLYDLKSGQVTSRLLTTLLPITAVSYSPNGRQIAASTGNLIQLFDVASGRQLATFYGHHRHVVSHVFDPQERWLAGIESDGATRVWSISDYSVHLRLDTKEVDLPKMVETKRQAAGQTYQGPHIQTLPDYRADYAQFTGRNRSVQAFATNAFEWDLASGRLLRVLLRLLWTSGGEILCLNPDGRSFLTIEEADVTKIDPKGSRIMPQESPRRFTFWNFETGEKLHSLLETTVQHTGWQRWIGRYSPDGQRVAITERSSHMAGPGPLEGVFVYDVRTGRLESTMKFAAGLTPEFQQFDNSGKGLLTSARSGRQTESLVRSVLPGKSHVTHLQGVSGFVKSCAWFPQNHQIALVVEPSREYPRESNPIKRVIQGNLSGGQIAFWDTLTGQPKGPSFQMINILHAVSHPSGSRVAASSGDGTVRIADVSTGQELLSIDLGEIARFVAFDQEGHRLLCSMESEFAITVVDGDPEERLLARSVEKCARSVVAHLRGTQRDLSSMLNEIDRDLTINDEIRAMAKKFAMIPTTKIIEYKGK